MKNNEEYDGMRYPSIDLLLEKVDSKYKLAYLAAKRAKIIESENYVALDDFKCVKPIGQALEEILEEKIEFKFKDFDSDKE